MATKKTPPKKSSASKSKSIKKAWYLRWQLWAFIFIFAIGGVAFLHYSHADSNLSCVSKSNGGNTLKFCTITAPSFSALQSTADFVAATNQTTMTSAYLVLEQCSPQTHLCLPVDPSATIRLYSSSQPRYQRLYTHGVTLLKGALYRTCFKMTSGSGWNLAPTCTPLVTYNGNVSNPPKTASGTDSSSSRITTTSTNGCGDTGIKKADGSAWRCTFDDEFNGSALDSSKWQPILTSSTSFTAAQDCYVNTPNNISIANGALNLTSRKEAAPFTCAASGSRASYKSQVTSATISTYQKFSQQYGRFEIRAKVPNIDTKGLQEAFWLWPNNVFEQDPGNAPWPRTGEIDIVEMYHSVPDRAIPYIHYDANSTTDPNVTNNYCYIDTTQYHTYTLTWTPSLIQVDIDGYNCITDHPKASSPQVSPQPFNKQFFLNLTSGLGVAANGNGYVDGTTQLPATTNVDYVRIWQ